MNIKLDKSFALFEEAKKYHPGGVLGIMRPYNFVENEYPIFFESGSGGKVTDVDGNEYIDMLCSYGPIVIGHREKEIDDSVIHQIRNKGFNLSLSQPVQNTLAKKLNQLIPCAEQSIFLKNGSDATSAAIRAARAYTNKTKIVRCGYHGWHDWCIDVKGGIPKKTYDDVLEFNYNDYNSLKEIIENNEGEIAAVILWPIHTPSGNKVEMPRNNFLQKVRELTTKKNIVLIFDEIRSGFRVDLGGAQKKFNVIPDLTAIGKAMANGYSIAALVGKREIMEVYSNKSFMSGTYFQNSTSMIAALKTIEFIEKNNVIEDLANKGNYFKDELNEILKDYGDLCEFSGSPWMPYITFIRDEKQKYKENRRIFFTEMIRKKIFWQPYHHCYFCYRHSYDDIDYVLKSINESLQKVSKDKNV
jgi:glutamate-1-semialdehyde aminotransferase